MRFHSSRYLLSFFSLCLMELSLSPVSGFEIVTYAYNSNETITVFAQNKPSIDFTYISLKCCQKNKLHQMSSIPSFSLITNQYDSLLKDNITFFIDNNPKESIVLTGLSDSNDSNNITINMNDVCNNSLTKIKRVTVEFQLNNTSYQFDYIQLCPDENNKTHQTTTDFIINIFTIIFLIVLMIGFIFGITYMTSSTALVDSQQKKTIELEWWYGCIIVFIGMLTSLFISFFPMFTLSIISSVILLVLTGVIYITGVFAIKHIHHTNRFPVNLKEFLKKETFKIKRYRIIAFILSFLIVSLWSFNHNWILLNILLYSLLFTANELISYKDYSNLLLFISCFLGYDIYWFLTQFYFHKFYALKTLERIDQPIKLVLPKFFNDDLLHPCYFISFIDILIVSYLIKYSKCFDVIKGNSSLVYYKTCLMLLGIGSLIVMTIQLLNPNDQIHLFPIELLVIGGMIIATAYKKDFKDFWNGKNIQGMQKVVDEIISNDNIQNNDIRDISYEKNTEQVSVEEND